VLPFQDNLGGWDRIEAVEELRAAMVNTESNLGELDRFVRASASSTNATAWNATALMATVGQTRPQRRLHITGPRRDAALQPHRSREYVPAAAASKECIPQGTSGVAGEHAPEEIVTTPDEDEPAADQEAMTVSKQGSHTGGSNFGHLSGPDAEMESNGADPAAGIGTPSATIEAGEAEIAVGM
jgi:hypothetical protein